jgi:hypothetical protein
MPLPEEMSCCTSSEALRGLLAALEGTEEIMQKLGMVWRRLRLQLEEASLLYSWLTRETGQPPQSMAAVLQRIHDPLTAHLLLERHFMAFGSRKGVLIACGPSFYPVFGLPVRRYRLDLSRPIERATFERLYEINNQQELLRRRRRPLKADTSMRANQSCFRNERFNGVPSVFDSFFFAKGGSACPHRSTALDLSRGVRRRCP